MMNNDFYFILKALYFFRYLYFSLAFFGSVGKQFDKKVKVSFKIVKLQTEPQTIRINKLPDVLKVKVIRPIWVVNRI